MDAKARSRLILAAWRPSLWEPDTGAEVTDESLAELGVMMESQIDAAVAAEREACAATLAAMRDEYAAGTEATPDPQAQSDWGHAVGVLRLAEARLRARGA